MMMENSLFQGVRGKRGPVGPPGPAGARVNFIYIYIFFFSVLTLKDECGYERYSLQSHEDW